MQRNLPTSKIRRHRTVPTALHIAIIVRTKDRPHLLTRCLQSLAEQKRLPDEVIVVNDAGVAINDVVNGFSNLNIHLINNATNLGRARAGNQGVEATHCEIIGFLDDDDRFLPEHLQRLEKAMLHFDAKVAYSGCRLLKRDMLGDKVILQEQAIGQFNDPYDAERLRYENYIPLINLLIDRALWLEVGGFDESFDVFEDWDVLLRLSTQTAFYHLNRITTEYAVWGSGQITQRMAQQHWRGAYSQFLKKHLMPLPEPEKLKFLAEYWRVSQERRGIVQDTTLEKQAQQLQLIQNAQTLEQLQSQLSQYQAHNQQLQQQHEQLQSEYAKQTAQLQSDWTTKYERLQSEHTESQSDWTTKYEGLQSEYAQLQADWIAKYQLLQSEHVQLQSDWTAKYQLLQSDYAKQTAQLQSEWNKKHERLQSEGAKQQAKIQETFAQLEKRYVELQAAAQQEQQQSQSLQETLHELSKQIALGLNQATIEKIRHSQAGAYALTISSESGVEDYQRLVNWIREKAGELHIEYPKLREQLAYLTQLISASHWPQIRRYANLVQDIDKQVENVFSHIEHYVSFSADARAKWDLSVATQHDNEIPQPRPLSNVYPTFTSFAGTPEKPHLMESANELGTIPFLLDTGEDLVFTVYCRLDEFFRLDILLATRSRINTCHLRVIIRDLNIKTPLRVLYLDGLEILDNRFHPIYFEPIADSAGKTYQIEIDSPDANEQSVIAVRCYPKPPILDEQQLPALATQHSPHTLPHWVQQSWLDLPLSTSLFVQPATHLFMLGGITESTPVLSLCIFLGWLGNSLKRADSGGQVVVCGQFSQALRQYCQQHQLTTLDNTQKLHIDLPAMLDWGKTQSAEYLWCCELDAMPLPNIVEQAMEIFVACPKAGLLVPMEKQSDGNIRAGYASLVRDGVLRTVSAGAPANHPYYGYRRTVEAASSQLVIMKMAGLSDLNINELSAYHTQMYQLTELIWQLKDQQYEAIYQAALCYEHDQPYPAFTDQDYNHDCHHFYQRWGDKLPTRALFAHLGELLNPQHQPTVLVIDATLPMYDEDSGSLRLYTLLKIWASMGYRITFFPDNLDSQFKYRYALESLGIEVFHNGYGIQDAMAYRQFDFAFICRVEIGHRYIPFVRLLSPDTVIFYDTVDIHYIREQRQAEIENDPKLATLAQVTKRKELSNCLLADRVITVTEDDAHHLQQELPNLRFSVIPNIHQLQPPAETNFEQREGLVFIGNYNHQPNEDAVYSFIETVLPKIHALIPEVCLYLIGSNMKDKMKALANEYVIVKGWVESVEPEFAKRRVFVSYLRYGAGMKGKLGQALSLGLPVVTTTIGAEGMGLVEDETALIADEPDHFAEAVCRLYRDSVLWEKLSRQGRDYIEQHYGEAAVRDQLRDLLVHYQCHG